MVMRGTRGDGIESHRWPLGRTGGRWVAPVAAWVAPVAAGSHRWPLGRTGGGRRDYLLL